MRRGTIATLTAIAALGAIGNSSTLPDPRGDAVTVYARGGNDYAAPVAPSRGKARPSAYANSAAKKRRRRRARGW